MHCGLRVTTLGTGASGADGNKNIEIELSNICIKDHLFKSQCILFLCYEFLLRFFLFRSVSNLREFALKETNPSR